MAATRAWLILGLLVVPVCPALAGVSTAAFTLNLSNTYSPQPFGSLSITADDQLGTVRFELTPYDVQPLYGELDNFGVQAFAFNYDAQAVSTTPAAWAFALPGGWERQTNRNISAFGRFDVLASGGGKSRKSLLDFTLTLPWATRGQAVAANFAAPSSSGYYFAAHIAGYENGPGSHWVALTAVPGPIPVPGAMVLGALGVTGLTMLRRRFASA